MSTEAEKAAKARYRASHREELRAKGRAYNATRKAARKAYYEANRERFREYRIANQVRIKARTEARREIINAQSRARRAANPEKCRAYYLANRHLFLARTRAYNRRRLASDPAFRLLHNLRGRIRYALKSGSKAAPTRTLIGCTIPEWRTHLESLFKPGMTWENYGAVWEVDHVIPCAKFDFSDPVQQRACFHFSNTQPLFAEENRRKSMN